MENELYHHGIKGMHWGIRRYQNPDGSLTDAGRKRYNTDSVQGKSNSSNFNAKKVAYGVLAAATVAGSAYVYMNNKDKIDTLVRDAITSLKLQTGGAAAAIKASPYTANAKQEYERVANRIKNVNTKIENVNTKIDNNFIGKNVKKGATKVFGAALEGAGIIAGKKIVDYYLGKEKSDNLIEAKNAYTKKDDRVKNKTVNDIIRDEASSAEKDAGKEVKRKFTS